MFFYDYPKTKQKVQVDKDKMSIIPRQKEKLTKNIQTRQGKSTLDQGRR